MANPRPWNVDKYDYSAVPALKRQGLTIREISARTNIPEESIKSFIKRTNRAHREANPVTISDEIIAVYTRKRPLSCSEIAKVLGTTKGVVAGVLYRYKLENGKGGN